jgi:hypothetical protein
MTVLPSGSVDNTIFGSLLNLGGTCGSTLAAGRCCSGTPVTAGCSQLPNLNWE